MVQIWTTNVGVLLTKAFEFLFTGNMNVCILEFSKIYLNKPWNFDKDKKKTQGEKVKNYGRILGKKKLYDNLKRIEYNKIFENDFRTYSL